MSPGLQTHVSRSPAPPSSCSSEEEAGALRSRPRPQRCLPATRLSVSTRHLIPSRESPPSYPCGFQNRTESNLSPDSGHLSLSLQSSRSPVHTLLSSCAQTRCGGCGYPMCLGVQPDGRPAGAGPSPPQHWVSRGGELTMDASSLPPLGEAPAVTSGAEVWALCPPQPTVEEASEEMGKTKAGNAPGCPLRTAAPLSSIHSTRGGSPSS